MNVQNLVLITLSPFRPIDYPQIDIEPVFVQYAASILLILAINFFVLYKLSIQMWKIFQQKLAGNTIHDIYDKIILHSSLKYVVLNIICLICFHDLTSLPVCIFKVFWLYTFVIIFMKFEIKQVFWPAFAFFFIMIFISSLGIKIWEQLFVFKLILIQTLTIVYYGGNQAYNITKALNAFYKSKHKNMQLSVQSLLQKNKLSKTKNEYDELTMNLELDEHTIKHLQNRRSFSLIFSLTLILNLILYMDLEAGKQLLGEVILSVVLDILPLYVGYWYLKKTMQQNEGNEENLRQSMREGEEGVGVRRNKEESSRRTSKIVIEMVDLKK